MALRRAPGVVYDEVGGRAVLIDADGHEMITLNPTGTLVWHALDGTRDVEAIAAHVHDEVDSEVSRERIEQDVRSFLDELAGEGLVVT